MLVPKLKKLPSFSIKSSYIHAIYLSNFSKKSKYSKYYAVLEIPDNSDQETVRRAFIHLCKKYHPDSQSSTSDDKKFKEVEGAYRCLQNKFSEDRWHINDCVGEYGLYYKEKNSATSAEEPQIFDIQHTAPQHRQYLSFDGVGSGNPAQRQKQYQKYRAVVATENVYEHRMNKLTGTNDDKDKLLVIKDKKESKKIKTRYGIDRLVEDLIQESMSKGEFENLSGKGKPLPRKEEYNPYVDLVTHKINQVLIENGFCPEWINLRKDIDVEIKNLKQVLNEERSRLAEEPLSRGEELSWQQTVERLKPRVKKINSNINQFNLVVPLLNQQMLYFNLDKDAENVLKNGESKKIEFFEIR